MKKANGMRLLILLCLCFVFLAGCGRTESEPAGEATVPETTASEFPEGQRLLLKVTPGNGHGGMAIEVSGKGSVPHVTCVEDAEIFLDGNYMDLGEALEAGLVTVEEMDAYARLDAKNGFCRMEYTSLNGLSLYVYHYDGFDIGSYYDVYEAPDGTQKHFQQLQIVTGNRYQDVGEYSVDYPFRVREDWGLSFEVLASTPDKLTLRITQTGGQHFGELHIGAGFDLKKDTGGTFKEECYSSLSHLVPAKNRVIANEAMTEVVITWPTGCRDLPEGEYTLNLFVEDHFDPEQIHPFFRDYTAQQNYEINFTVGDQ